MEDLLISFYNWFVDSSLLNDLIDEGLIMPLWLTLIIINLIAVGIFYYLDTARSSRPRWFMTIFGIGLIVFAVHFFTCQSMSDRQIPRSTGGVSEGFLFDQGTSIFFMFSLQMFFVSLVLFFLLSIGAKNLGFSPNCRKTPF